jgi:hypothetical protein
MKCRTTSHKTSPYVATIAGRRCEQYHKSLVKQATQDPHAAGHPPGIAASCGSNFARSLQRYSELLGQGVALQEPKLFEATHTRAYNTKETDIPIMQTCPPLNELRTAVFNDDDPFYPPSEPRGGLNNDISKMTYRQALRVKASRILSTTPVVGLSRPTG